MTIFTTFVSLTRLAAMLAAAWIGLRMLILAQSMPALHRSQDYLRKSSRWADAKVSQALFTYLRRFTVYNRAHPASAVSEAA